MNIIRIGRSLCITGLIVFWLMGCDRPDAPGCLMRAGDYVEIVETFSDYPRGLKLYNHMNVVLEPWDSTKIELVWSGPEHVLAHRWSAWEGEMLELGHEDRCQWMRDLGVNVGLTIRTPIIPEIALHGQGRFDAALEDSTLAVVIDAWAYAGYLTVACDLDSLTMRLHAGACSAVAAGDDAVSAEKRHETRGRWRRHGGAGGEALRSEESVGALVLRGGVCGLLTVSPIRIEECFAALVLHKICEAHSLAVVG